MTAQQDFLIDIFELSTHDLCYFAGLFDGEGTITLGKIEKQNTYSFGISIAMVSPRAINDWHSAFGGSIKLREYKNPKWRPLYYWYAYGSRAELILQTLLPYLRVKKEEAELALRMRNYKRRKGFSAQRNRLVKDILEIRHGKELEV